MLIFDGHLDLALNALQNNRDLTLDAYTTSANESNTVGKGKAKGTVALPQMRAGRVACCITSLCARCTGAAVPHFDFNSPMQTYGIAQGQLAYYWALEQAGHARIILNDKMLDNLIAEWKRWESDESTDLGHAPPLGIIVSMESADPVMSPEQLDEWYRAGLRVIGPAHGNSGRYAGGTGCELGLTEMGPALLLEMDRLGILLDLTHLSDRAFWQSLDTYQGRVLASHCNCRALVPHQREFDDNQLRAILERDGIIGVTLGNWQLQFGWVVGARNENLRVTLDRAVDHIDHICQLAGDTDHVGIGSDLDGGTGSDEFPTDLDTIADLQRIGEHLSARNYSDEVVASILHRNWIEFLRKSWQIRSAN